MLARRAAAHRAVLFDFLAPSAARCRAPSRALHGSKLKHKPAPEPTPEEREALFNSLRRVVKDRRFNKKLTNTQIDEFHRDLQIWRAGILNGDLEAVVRTSRKMKRKELLALITHRDWKELSYFVSNAISDSRRYDVNDPALVELAVDAASANGGGTGEAAFALKRILTRYFRARDYARLLEVYNTFLAEARASRSSMQRRAGDQASSPGKRRWGEDGDVAEDESQADAYLQHSPGVFDLHLCALGAYHALGQFREALDTMVGVQVRWTPTAITNFCKDAYIVHEKSASFSLFVEHIRAARMIKRPKWLAFEIGRMQDSHDSQRLIALFESVVYTCENSPQWLQTQEAGPSDVPAPLQLHEVVWIAFLNAFAQMRLFKYVESAWDTIHAQRVPVTQAMWNVWLLAHALDHRLPETLRIWKNMVDLGQIDAVSYTTMLKAYVTFGLPDEAFRLFEHLQQVQWRIDAGGKVASDSTKEQLYNIMIDGLLHAPPVDGDDKLQRAESLLSHMKKHGPAPSIYTHNAFLHYHANRGDVPAAATRLRYISQEGFTPDIASFTIMLQGLLKANHPNAAKTIVSLVHAFGVTPETQLYSAILSCIMGNDGERHVQEAFRILDIMEASDVAKPDQRSYSIVLAGLFRQRSLDASRRAQFEQEVRRRMERAGTDLSSLSYNHIIASCLEPMALPTPEMLDTGLRYYDEMIRRGSLPNNKAWQLVIDTLWKAKNDIVSALEVADTMSKKGVRGDWPLQTLVEKVRTAAARLRRAQNL
ncbi:hypothetical protein EXIGLDRAFT_759723 [Exidia glandulosa HHB12029]|uniref:Pentacotripeptide-repeat region of PRORP domain-containing protein n=1 Tax=Exidia glandulosa HHB12029 TaxID=1314781 RepID=A0A165PS71_EXIGL|nr:hypothetical protein EXIGLDRAFT_759723 [Exidia glandulosa HHB12029]